MVIADASWMPSADDDTRGVIRRVMTGVPVVYIWIDKVFGILYGKYLY